MNERLRDLTVLAGDFGIRPAGKPDECFYCNHRVGERHAPDCAVVEKEVELRAAFEDGRSALFKTTVPHCWDTKLIYFQFNEATWCADNLLGYEGTAQLAQEAVARLDESGRPCLCGHVRITLERVVDPGPFIFKK